MKLVLEISLTLSQNSSSKMSCMTALDKQMLSNQSYAESVSLFLVVLTLYIM